MKRLVSALLAIVLPLLFVVLALRLVTLPWFPRMAYALPGFPPDHYGLTRAQRIALADRCLAELNLPQGPSLFRAARLPDGSPAFTEAERSHMEDVRRLYDRLTRLMLGVALVFAVGTAWLWRREGRQSVGRVLIAGGLLTIVLLFLLAFGIFIDWEGFFVGLHHLFFAEGTWRFAYESTLIRLFPERFWQVAAATVTLVIIALAVAGLALGLWLRRSPPADPFSEERM